jgi:Na+/phosphate symporter
MITYLSLLVALIGVFIFAFAANPKLVRIGEIMIGCGLLAFLIVFGSHTENLGH